MKRVYALVVPCDDEPYALYSTGKEVGNEVEGRAWVEFRMMWDAIDNWARRGYRVISALPAQVETAAVYAYDSSGNSIGYLEDVDAELRAEFNEARRMGSPFPGLHVSIFLFEPKDLTHVLLLSEIEDRETVR